MLVNWVIDYKMLENDRPGAQFKSQFVLIRQKERTWCF